MFIAPYILDFILNTGKIKMSVLGHDNFPVGKELPVPSGEDAGWGPSGEDAGWGPSG
jgi:hypothetical protein